MRNVFTKALDDASIENSDGCMWVTYQEGPEDEEGVFRDGPIVSIRCQK